jgi:tetrahydromethanopterin S-methyltransferase subunit C
MFNENSDNKKDSIGAGLCMSFMGFFTVVAGIGTKALGASAAVAAGGASVTFCVCGPALFAVHKACGPNNNPEAESLLSSEGPGSVPTVRN